MADVELVLDWDTLPKLYQFCEEVAKRGRKGGGADLRSDVQRLAEGLGIDDVDALGRSIASGKLAEGLGLASDEQSSRAVAELLARTSGPVMTAFASCAKNKMSPSTRKTLSQKTTLTRFAIPRTQFHLPRSSILVANMAVA